MHQKCRRGGRASVGSGTSAGGQEGESKAAAAPSAAGVAAPSSASAAARAPWRADFDAVAPAPGVGPRAAFPKQSVPLDFKFPAVEICLYSGAAPAAAAAAEGGAQRTPVNGTVVREVSFKPHGSSAFVTTYRAEDGTQKQGGPKGRVQLKELALAHVSSRARIALLLRLAQPWVRAGHVARVGALCVLVVCAYGMNSACLRACLLPRAMHAPP